MSQRIEETVRTHSRYQSKRIEVIETRWVRFNAYEVVRADSGVEYVRPARGAELIAFDPWSQFNGARPPPTEKAPAGKVVPPYQDLFRLLRELDDVAKTSPTARLHARRQGAAVEDPEAADPLALGQQAIERAATRRKLIETWCSRFGLLGLLHQQAIAFFDGSGRAFTRTGHGWRHLHQAENAALAITRIGPFSSHVATGEAAQATWARHFPGCRWPAYPRPGTVEFWREYAEPVDDFLTAARELRRIMVALSELRPDGERRSRREIQRDKKGRHVGAIPEAIAAEQEIAAAEVRLNAVLATVSQAARLDLASGAIRTPWPCPSLLSALALMILKDAQDPKRVWRICHDDDPVLGRRGCGAKFSGTPYAQQTWCSSACRDAANYVARKHRRREEAEQKRKTKALRAERKTDGRTHG